MFRWIKINYDKLQNAVQRKYIESNYQYIDDFFKQYGIWKQRFYHLKKRPVVGAKIEKIIRMMWIDVNDIKVN